MKHSTAIAALAIVIVGTGSFVAQAQQKKNSSDHSIDSQKARDEVSKSRVATSFAQSLSRDNPEWKLSKAQSLEIGKAAAEFGNTNFVFEKGSKSVGVVILDFESESKAANFEMPLMSYGTVVPFKDYGDSGEKILGDRGDLVALRFRKGRFYVQIFHSELKTSRVFAEQALKAINSVQ